MQKHKPIYYVLICLGILGMLLSVKPVMAQEQMPDLATYENLLREARIAAQRGDRLGLEQVAPDVVQIDTVRLPDGTTLPVDNTWLAESLASANPDLVTIEARLGALVDALAQPDAAVSDDAQQRLQTMLNRPPFAAAETQESLIGRFFSWVLRVLERLLSPINVSPQTGSVVVWLFAILGAALLLGVLLYLLLGMRVSLAHEARMDQDADPDANLTASEAVQQATALARGGDYRSAVRYLYLSSLLWLDERGLLRYDRMLTNREYLDRLAHNHELRDRMIPIVDTFDRVWYGHTPLDAEGFASYQQQVNDLRK